MREDTRILLQKYGYYTGDQKHFRKDLKGAYAYVQPIKGRGNYLNVQLIKEGVSCYQPSEFDQDIKERKIEDFYRLQKFIII